MKIALVVPGYGSQYIGMGKELYEKTKLSLSTLRSVFICIILCTSNY